MKAFELYALYESFARMMASTAFNNAQKLAIGREMVQSLPPIQFSAATPKTHDSIEEAMTSQLETLIERDKPTQEDPKPADSKAEGNLGVKAKGKQSLHKTPGV